MGLRMQISYSTPDELEFIMRRFKPDEIYKIGKERKYGEHYRREIWPNKNACKNPEHLV